MKNLCKFLLVLAASLALAGCAREYDDSKLQNQINSLTEQVAELARKVSDLNLQVVAMKEVLDQWKAGGYIQGIDNSIAGQHTITFLGGKTVVLYDGSDGTDGTTPDIGIKEENGEWFWYVGDTKLGPSSYIPVFSVNDEGEFIVTVNGVVTNLGRIKSQSYFKEVITQEDKVVFVLEDDTRLEIPMAKAFKLVISETEKEVAAGESVHFPYTVQNGNATTTVDAFASGHYQVDVQAEEVVVTVPNPCVAGQVLVWAQNGEGLFSMVKLSFTPASGSDPGVDPGEDPVPEASITIVSVSSDLTAIPAAAGNVVLNLVSNVDVEMAPPGVDWVTAVLTKADYTLTLDIQENTTPEPRETELQILRSDTKEVVQTIKLVQVGKPAPDNPPQNPDPQFTVKRVWGKFSTAEAPWHGYLGDFNVNADRNVAMDDYCIYIAEAKPGVKKIWGLKLEDGSFGLYVPTSTVKDAGTFPLCCTRVVNLDGQPVLIVSNMTEDAAAENFWLYVYENGVGGEPTAIQLSGAMDRMGDTFSFWGASATSSFDGQGLTKGLLYFDSTNNNGVRIWKTVWNKGSLPVSQQWVQSRYGFDNGNTSVGAFWAFPDTKDSGVWGGRGTAENPVKSSFGSVLAGAPNLWSATGNQVPNTQNTVIESGYYNNVAAYQFIEFMGMRYVAYAKQVDGADGRLIILEGNPGEDWASIINSRRVIYQAAIQEDAEMQEDYNPSPMASGHSGMDLCARVIGDKAYIVVLKQNVGLSLFSLGWE